ncbi:MAG: hypothetical protein QOJ29_519, partial [Thermoleophilaceae bacterium]|nr:hypothetical protein [Thermoleophilaceae bacterium]
MTVLRSRTLEAVAASLALAVALLITFSGDPGLEFLIFPAFVWIGLRLGVRAEAEIRRSEERYRRLVENMHDGLWATDADGRTTFMNDRMLELIGGTIDDYIGRDALAFAHPDDIPQIAADRDKADPAGRQLVERL